MKKSLCFLLLISVIFSCTETIENTEKTIENKDSISNQTQEKVSTEIIKTSYDEQTVKAKILSFEETLIMPSDYLSTAMTVCSATNDTLVFLDMFGFEAFLNKEIEIKYKLIPESKLLVCSDCNTYTKKVKMYDITTFASTPEFVNLKLVEYIPDEYIIPASQFMMLTEDGETEVFFSNNNELIADSSTMKSAFKSYGVVTKSYPELLNREALESLLE